MNLLFPFLRDQKHDFASGDGDALFESKVRLVLGVIGAGARSYGELKWRTNFGSQLQLIRHKNSTVEMQALAETYCQQALDRWMPGTSATVTAQRIEDKLSLTVAAKRGRVSATVSVPLSQ